MAAPYASSSAQAGGSSMVAPGGVSQAAPPPDALGLLAAALSATSPAAEDPALEQLYELLHSAPGNIPPLFDSLINILPRAGPSMTTWVLRVCSLVFCRPSLNTQTKLQLAPKVPETLLHYLSAGPPSPPSNKTKTAIEVFTSLYPLLFRLCCDAPQNPALARAWSAIEQLKARTAAAYDSIAPSSKAGTGVRIAVFKFWQRAVLVGTRAANDPRYMTPKHHDANLLMIPPNHPYLNVAVLEQEANKFLTQLITVVFTSANCTLITAALNTLALLAKARPTLSPIVLEALTSWTPVALTGRPHHEIRNAEKTLRVLFFHFHPERNSYAGAHAQQLVEAIARQRARMEAAAREDAQRRLAAKTKADGKRKAEEGKPKRKKVRWSDFDDNGEGSDAPTPPPAAPPAAAAPAPAPAPVAVPKEEPAAAPGPVPAIPVGPSHPALDVPIGAQAFAAAAAQPGRANPLSMFNVASLEAHLVIELTLAGLSELDPAILAEAIERTRSGIIRAASGAPPPLMALGGIPGPPPGPPPGAPPPIPPVLPAAEQSQANGTGGSALNPLQIDVDEDELALTAAPEPANDGPAEGSKAGAGSSSELAALEGFVLPPPERLGPAEARDLIHQTVSSMCEVGAASMAPRFITVEDEAARAQAGPSVTADADRALWATLVTRLATRAFADTSAYLGDDGVEGKGKAREVAEVEGSVGAHEDAVRALMLGFVRADFQNRIAFAAQWMAEEWHCDALARRRRGKQRDASAEPDEPSSSNYERWLSRLVQEVLPVIEGDDKALQRLLADVPSIPSSVIDVLRELCVDRTRMRVGFTILREVALVRPPSRRAASSILLDLTRSADKPTRNAAIITVRGWVGQSPALEAYVLEHAREGLRIITGPPPEKPVETAAEGGDEQMEAKEEAAEQSVKPEEWAGSPPQANGATAPAPAADDTAGAAADVKTEPAAPVWDEADVLRHVQLLFALCIKMPSLLDEIFAAYPSMLPSAQSAVELHIADLIKSLGPKHEGLLNCLRNFPEGADGLALCAFTVLTEKGRPGKLVNLVKKLVEERNVDPRFLVPIMPDLSKDEIKKSLPRVVTMLKSGKPEDRALIKSLFASVVVAPAAGFGSVSTNLPRVRAGSLLTAVELMVLLAHSETEIGIKATVDAVRICFGMPDIFRSEVIGAVLNQIVEEPVLPSIFMRLAMTAVSTYKSLSNYVSANLLTRLITKKVWTTPLLWDGFVLCARQTAPGSFGALIQLPKEQLSDVLRRQPVLRDGLREYLEKKAGGNKARLAEFLKILGDEPEKGDEAAAPAKPQPGSGASTPMAAVGTPSADP